MTSPIAPAGSSFPSSTLRNTPQGKSAKSLTPTRNDRDQVDPDIREAAEGMEALFLDYLMKTMRETIPKNDFDLENAGTRIYRGMLDSETTQRAARQGGVGLADQIIAYLQAQRYNASGATATGTAPAVSTGGTNAGHTIRK